MVIFTLLIFVGSIWSVEHYASRLLHADMQRLLGEQQLQAATILATGVSNGLQDRLKALETVAAAITPALLNDKAALQSMLQERRILQSLFNGGIIISTVDGTEVAEYPRSSGRAGTNYRQFNDLTALLSDGKPLVSRLITSPTLKAPIFALGMPIRNPQGHIVGALVGATRLDKPNFLDQPIQGFQGQSGGYLLVAPQQRLVITASDTSRVMEVLPPAGASLALDRFIQGYEGSDVFINPRGVEVLASARGIALAGWYAAVILPTAQAFAPIDDLQQRMLFATLMLTVLAAVLTWWMLKRELSPLLDAANTLANLPHRGQPTEPLPIARNDEVGRLIGGFNHLIESLTQREEALQESETRFRSLMEQIPGVAVQGYAMDGTVTYWNAAAEKLYGYTRAEAMGGNLLQLIIPPDMREGIRAAMQHMAQSAEPIPAGELLLQTKSGSRVPVFSSHALLKPVGRAPEMFCLDVDLSETKRAQEQVRQMAFYDLLTGLPNRRLLGDRLSQAMAASKRNGVFGAMMFLDLDNFKPLNDAHGHGVGDLLLMEVAHRLNACVREMDTVSRFGGDEFVVMLSELSKDRTSSTDQALAVAEKIRMNLAAPYRLVVKQTGQADTIVEHHCSASIGVVVFVNHEFSESDILQWADAAMYQAKDAGRNTIRLHQTS